MTKTKTRPRAKKAAQPSQPEQATSKPAAPELVKLSGAESELFKLAQARYSAAIKQAGVVYANTMAKAGVDVFRIEKVDEVAGDVVLTYGAPKAP